MNLVIFRILEEPISGFVLTLTRFSFFNHQPFEEQTIHQKVTNKFHYFSWMASYYSLKFIIIVQKVATVALQMALLIILKASSIVINTI